MPKYILGKDGSLIKADDLSSVEPSEFSKEYGKNINKDIVSDFKKKEKTFKQQEQDLISKKNVLSEDEFVKEVKKFDIEELLKEVP